ncbi:right-handed parallel beta-helix repeat-containing protein [Methylomonas koyamae]|uniref:right-handed parallel beta-helix repeat-containing protein n=1 Tax=Methylomonas koyamae TaxID=702114 RepID=UPI002873ECE2|nr:right-handed parallel beta-helix repeat-containing protein [Methylomonas koyamae]WNB77420.1 hypothetical protein RI210_07520 [Methylomonas koyamae]
MKNMGHELSKHMRQIDTVRKQIGQATQQLRQVSAEVDRFTGTIRERTQETHNTAQQILEATAAQLDNVGQLQARVEALFEALGQNESKAPITRTISDDLYQVAEKMREMLEHFIEEFETQTPAELGRQDRLLQENRRQTPLRRQICRVSVAGGHARPAILPSTVSTMPQPTRPKRFRLRTGAALACLLALNAATAKDWYVGPQRTLKLPSQAARLAGDGDTVHIDAAVYSGDVAVWPQHRLTLRGSGGWARLHANGLNAEGKAIWVIKGDRVEVENIEFTGAEAQALNGAGIRYEGRSLTLRHCHIHHNQMGLLTGADPEREILIEGSEFNDNTVDYRLHGKLGHNVYIGNIKRFTLRNCYIHDAATGHNVKSRAKFNFLLYNRIGDEQRASSYLVDLPDGGESYLIGNQLYQAADSENPAMVSFAAEHNQAEPYTLYLVNNTLVNAKAGSYFLHNHNVAAAVLINNLLVGQAATIQGPFRAVHNVQAEQELFADGGRFDYRLRAGAGAIDQGADPGISATGAALAAEFEYRHPLGLAARPSNGPIDAGAYEFAGER